MLTSALPLVSVLLLSIAGFDMQAGSCHYDREAILELGQEDFDQGPNGWRKVASQKGCDEAAADLVEAYRERMGSNATILWMHEAQLRTFAGDYARAKPLFARAKHKTEGFGWNDYIDATVAFIDRDKSALLAAWARLAATPTPDSHPWFDESGNPIPAPPWSPEKWPLNLPVVDALIRCFDRPYKEAYTDPACFEPRAPAASLEPGARRE